MGGGLDDEAVKMYNREIKKDESLRVMKKQRRANAMCSYVLCGSLKAKPSI